MLHSCFRPCLIAAVALIATACTNDLVSPSTASTARVRTTFAEGGERRAISNAIKYKDAGKKATRARSGAASLEARALLGKDGMTTVEATTGSLEAGTTLGQILKLQLKIFSGDTLATNYNKLTGGGYWTRVYPSMARGDQLQLHANVGGIETNRTDIVTAPTSVALRPDLMVRSVTGPTQSAPNTMVTFVAVVSELNGDVGARANCVLSINGVQADQANGIWVDAGGTVSCMFTRMFNSPGSYSISVTASGVNPGDWDGANNVATTSVTIGEPIQRGILLVFEEHTVTTSRWWNAGPYPFESNELQPTDISFLRMGGVNAGTGYGAVERIDAALSVDGIVVRTASLVPIIFSNYDDGDSYASCRTYEGGYFDGSTFYRLADGAQMCRSGRRTVPGSEQTSYEYGVISGEATYYSEGFYCEVYGCSTYTLNSAIVYGAGTAYEWQAGTIVGLQVSFLDDRGIIYAANKSVQLETKPGGFSRGSCYADLYRGGQTCFTEQRAGSLLLGELTW